MGVKRSGCDVDNSPPSSAKNKKECSFNTALSLCLCGMNQDNITVNYTTETAEHHILQTKP